MILYNRIENYLYVYIINVKQKRTDSKLFCNLLKRHKKTVAEDGFGKEIKGKNQHKMLNSVAAAFLCLALLMLTRFV